MGTTYTVVENPFKKITPETKKKIKKFVPLLIVIVIALIVLSSCWYTVKETESAVVVTFGKVTAVVDEAGMHFKAPFGIQRVHKLEVNVIKKVEIGFKTLENGSTVSVDNESKMITGDFNIVNVDFFVEYRISNPEKYLYSSVDPEAILKSLVQSQIRTVVGSYGVDDVLTTQKNAIQGEIKESIYKELQEYDFGITLESVKIQDAEAPNEAVSQAFKAVETAKQGKETAINEAQAYENAEIPKAEAQADKLLQDAQYRKQNRINEAKERVAMFEAMYSEYILNPDITKRRMYYEMLEEVLKDVKLIIMTDDGNTQTFLPLDKLA
ncbi:MAG: FtsH protease activity modulator HflK [Clostridia bacterium]|nr:FtsH protease activity modulator HflK [Clostridia bacterium]